MAGGRYLSISFEATELRYVTSDGKKVTGWGTEPLEPGMVTDGLITDPKLMSVTLADFLKSKKLRGKRIVSSVAGIRSLPRILRIPKLPPKLVAEAVRHEAGRQMPLPMNEMYVAHSHLEDVGDEAHYFVMGMPRQRIENLVSSLEQIKPKSYRLDLKSTALARAANIERGIVVDIEPSRVEIVVILDSTPLITRTMIMTDPGMAHEDRVRRIAAEVAHTVAFHNANQPDNRIEPDAPVILTGKLASDADLKRQATQDIVNPIQTLLPSLLLPGDFPSNEYAACIGMAVIAKKKKPPKASNKPQKKKQRSKGNVTSPALELLLTPANVPPKRSPKKFVLLSLAASILVALLFVAYRFDLDGSDQTTDLTFRLESVTLQLNEVQKTAEAKVATNERIALLEAEALELMGESQSFADGVDAVFGNITDGVAPTNVSIRGDDIIVEGYASTRTAAINYLGLIEETELFSAVNIASLSSVDLGPDVRVMQFIINIDQ